MDNQQINENSRRRGRSLSRLARTSFTLGLGIALGAGGLALGDISTSPSGVKSGTVLTCAGKHGALTYSPNSRCRRSKRRLVLADSAPLIATVTAPAAPAAQSPGIRLTGTATPGDYELTVSSKAVRDIRKCAYLATPSVMPVGGTVTKQEQVSVVAAPLDAHHVLFHEFDSSGQAASAGISLEIYCPQ